MSNHSTDHDVTLLVDGKVTVIPREGEPSVFDKAGSVIATPFVATGKVTARTAGRVATALANKRFERKAIRRAKEEQDKQLLAAGAVLLLKDRQAEAAKAIETES